MKNSLPYKRILLKLSGEMLSGPSRSGIHSDATLSLAKSLKILQDSGVTVGIVIGGGNIFRGINANELGLQRTPADHMGMLATLINGIALQNTLQALGCKVHLMSALECPKVAEPYVWSKAMDHLAKEHIVIFVGGTGNPYFTTDTAAALRASEIGAEALLKATKVDGVFNKDPLKNPDATRYDTIRYEDYLAQKIGVMDSTAVALCMNNRIPILVFNMNNLVPEKVLNILSQKLGGTLIQS